VRPLRLEIEGFTSFRDRVVLDFTELDLFAITGPTGAGKSSLIDAMVFALYGQVPRVGNEYRQLLSHGKERLSVRLDFSVGSDRYRVVRTMRASGAPQTRLERTSLDPPEALADRVKEANEEVERIVGLDYDAFTRSVVLPQGQFDAFLKGEPRERRKILVALLNLQVYERMHEAANRRGMDAGKEAAFIEKQLLTDYAGATPEALEGRRAELLAAEQARAAAETALASLGEAVEAAHRLRASRREAEGLEREAAVEGERAKQAEAVRAEAATRREALAGSVRGLEDRLAASGGDGERQGRLQEARPLLRQLSDVAPLRARLEDESRQGKARLAAKKKDSEAAGKSVPAAEKALGLAEAAEQAARARREELQRQHAAHGLRLTLEPGEPCPVCTQPVVLLPPAGKAPETGEAELGRAAQAVKMARMALADAQLGVERLRGETGRIEAEALQAEKLLAEAAERIAGLQGGLKDLGFGAAAKKDPSALLRDLEAELQQLDKARLEKTRLEAEHKRLQAEHGALQAREAAETAKAEEARRRGEEIEARRASAAAALDEAQASLSAALHRAGLPPPQTRDGRDEADLLESRREGARRDALRAAEAAARLGAEAAAMERNVARAAELREKKRTLDARAALAQSLALHLRADQFLAYVQEEALRALAQDGSRHLRRLSQGRYSLRCEDQEFFVIDHWNADGQRSVKTLSGGETFLASLGLALALAESLATLSAQGRAAEALESLFLDEGFGTLDSATLDQVREAIEALHGGERMVGLVTHIAELAEQMPARVEVGRSERGATLHIN
jgi:exonuclease SbcC